MPKYFTVLIASLFSLHLSFASGDGVGLGLYPEATPQSGPENFLNALNVDWYYNWQPQATLGVNSVDFTPMLWFADIDSRGRLDPVSFQERINLAIANLGDSNTILGFNEPDHEPQANMTVKQAIQAWRFVEEARQALGFRVGSPAPTTFEAYGRGTWLQQFMAQAEKRNYQIDFIAVHWYDHPVGNARTQANSFFQYLTDVFNTYQRPIWVTEFDLVNFITPELVTTEAQAAFMKEVILRLPNYPFIERIAQFPGRIEDSDRFYAPSVISDHFGNLNILGETYAEYAKLHNQQ